MKRLVIEIQEPRDRGNLRRVFDVIDEQDRRADNLNFEELLGQIISMTHPNLDGCPKYAMQTIQERAAEMSRTSAAAATWRD